jgi:hypothetical protein
MEAIQLTNKQKQHLLAYLGYYDGKVDGIWGSISESATIRFQKDYDLEPDGIVGKLTEKKLCEVVGSGIDSPKQKETVVLWENIKYFKKEEFACKCGLYCDGFPVEPKSKLVTVADRVREHFGKSAIVSSGVRCKQHNANVGGVANSRHLYGKAMDFCVIGETAKEVLAYAQAQPEIRYAYAIDQNYIHMDIE